MKPRRRILSRLLLAAFLIWTLLSGGLVIELIGGFEFTSGHGALYASDQGVRSSVEILVEDRSYGIPFVCWVHDSSGCPFDVELRSVDFEKEARHLRVSRIEVVQGDQRFLHLLDPPWSRPYQEVELCFAVEDGKLKNVPVGQLRELLPVSVPLEEDCTIQLDGELEMKDGTRSPFELHEQVEYRPEWRAYTLWSSIHD